MATRTDKRDPVVLATMREESLSYEETARRFGIAVSTVKAIVRRNQQ